MRLLFNLDGTFEVLGPESEDELGTSDELRVVREKAGREETRQGSKTVSDVIAIEEPQGSDVEPTMTAAEVPKEFSEQTAMADATKPGEATTAATEKLQPSYEEPASKGEEPHNSDEKPIMAVAEVPKEFDEKTTIGRYRQTSDI
ncbi:uncharacterized protein [Penaeus vannamei]|uniref:uncharacterized protein isoform X2 n=1 Tax=Penaeus vannamei TaxID=6689 RepID=UPI00387FAED2